MSGGRDAEFTDYVNARGAAWERYAYVLTGDRHQAQDLLQTVLLTAYRKWRRIAEVEHPDAYVRRMLTHAYLSWRRTRGSTELPVEDLPEPSTGATPDPAVTAVDRDELQRALATLSPHQRAVLVLRHVEGLADEAIAATLGCSLATVRTHASRGRDRFRIALTASAGPVELRRADAAGVDVARKEKR